MNRGIVALAALLVTGVAAGNVSAAKPGSGELTITASKSQVTFSKSVVIAGQLKTAPVAAQQVELEATEFPFNNFNKVATATTDASGNYSFTVTPNKSTRYRVVTVTKPKTTSSEAQVNVAIKVTRRVSDSTPARGKRVRFSGLVAPALAGRPVTIERRAADGSWKVAATTTANAESKYAKRIKIRRNGTYRATVAGTDAGLLTGHSRRIKLRVH